MAWALAGLSPHLRELTWRDLPKGAILGRNSFGHASYSLCPPKHSIGHYAVLLYAVPHHVSVARNFDAESLVEQRLVHIVRSEGELFFSYKRR